MNVQHSLHLVLVSCTYLGTLSDWHDYDVICYDVMGKCSEWYKSEEVARSTVQYSKKEH